MIIRRMVSNPGNRWAVAASTFVVWGLVAASAVYWGMKLSSGSSAPVAPAVRAAPPPDPAAIARLLGAVPVAAAPVASLASRFQLLGVVADVDGGGAALIAVDGKPPKPFRVGANVDEGLVLQSVEPRRATLGPTAKSPAALTLELPRKP
jgi:general secretion pathway protein C